MAATLTDIFRIMKEIRDKIGRTTALAIKAPSVSVDLSAVAAELANLLSELQTQTTTLSTLVLNATVAGHQASLTAIDGSTAASAVDLAALEVLITETNVKLENVKTFLNSPNETGDEWLGKILGSTDNALPKLDAIEGGLKQPITGLDWLGLIFIDTTAMLVLLNTIDSNTNSLENIGSDAYRTYHYAAEWVSTGLINLRVQWALEAHTKPRYLRIKRTSGSGVPALTVVLYNPIQGRDIFTLITAGGNTDHQIQFGQTENSLGEDLAGSKLAIRIDIGLTITSDTYDVDLVMEHHDTVLPTRTQFGTAFTETVQRESIDR